MSEIRQFLETLLHRHTEIDEIKEDMREDYKAAQSAGFDKAALGATVREIRARAKAETPKAQERAALVDLYLAEYDRASHVHVRETFPDHRQPDAELSAADDRVGVAQ